MACVLVLAAVLLAGALSEPRPNGQAVCKAGDGGCAVAQDHVLLQHSRLLALKHAAVKSDAPDEIFFDAVVRDFTWHHPDFESMYGHVTGLVESRLGADGKPVFRGGSALTTKANFDQWYHDCPSVNKRLLMKLTLTRTTNGTYLYENSRFFPIDGKGWGDWALAKDGRYHNFYFTLELNTSFVYRGGEMFHFRGDDDVWVFINGELVIDLGGVHNPIEGRVNLDTLNLQRGAMVTLNFFFAERRCCGSNFRIETDIGFPAPKTGTCVLWGDPHVSVFDRSLANKDTESVPLLGIFDSGDFWLVKSDSVKIQGRYGPTQFSANRSALLALAVGGPFLYGNTLVIGPMEDEGKVMWNGGEIVPDIPSRFFIGGFVNISFFGDAREHLVDPQQRGLPLRTVTAQLPKHVDLTVNRWQTHIDAIIKLRQLPEDMDGHCGTFDGNPADDTQAQILARMGAEVPASESLLGPWPESLGEHGIGGHRRQEVRLEDCQPQLRQEAERLCAAAELHRGGGMVPSKSILEACIFDVCFAGREFAAEDAVMERQVPWFGSTLRW